MRDQEESVRGWEAGGKRKNGVCVCVCEITFCVSVADLLVWKQIFSLSDSINLPHLS